VIRHDLPGGVHAVFTSRAQGNLSTMRGAEPGQGIARRAALCERLGLRWLCAGPQVHGSAVQAVHEQLASGGEALGEPADGRATGLHEVGVMVLSADCVPVIVACEGAVAALHAGWRGLAAGVLEAGVRTLRELADGASGPARAPAAAPVSALIGPCAGPCCYEVGPEVHAAFGVTAARRGTIDLPALAAQRLRAAGVAEIEQAGVCTICDERYFSHRREGERAGRQAGIAWLS
jgi:purine-nucleoside/S-methyl-5'-thioadenosine phosphorylase / adenosine deaminase